jgi:hypothetical protein
LGSGDWFRPRSEAPLLQGSSGLSPPAGSPSPPKAPTVLSVRVAGTSPRRRGACADGSHGEPGAALSVACSTQTRTTSKSSSSRARGYCAWKAESPALRSSPRRTSAMARCRCPRLGLRRPVRRPQAIDVDVVKQRGESCFPVLTCDSAHAVQRTLRTQVGSASGVRFADRVLLAQAASLPRLRRRLTGLVRRVRRYYQPVRLLMTVHLRRTT